MRAIHPPTRSSPPIGVIAPSHFCPDKTRIYKLPEKIIIPEVKSALAYGFLAAAAINRAPEWTR